MSTAMLEEIYEQRKELDYGNIVEKSRIARKRIHEIIASVDEIGVSVDDLYGLVRNDVREAVGEDYSWDLFISDLSSVMES